MIIEHLLEEKYSIQIRNSSAKLAFFLEDRVYFVLRHIYEKEGILLPQNFFTFHRGFALIQNHFIYPLIQEAVRRLSPSGIIRFLWEKVYLKIPINKRPQVLTIDDLRFGFMVWLAAFGISSLVFVCEVTWVRTKNFVIKITRAIIGIVLFLELLSESRMHRQRH